MMCEPDGDTPDDDKSTGEIDALVFDDLLTAMGRTDRHECPELGMTIERADILALDKVFHGKKMSCASKFSPRRNLQLLY
jgi:hypothetical protein